MEILETFMPLNPKDERIQWCEDNLIGYFGSSPKYMIDNDNKLVIDGSIIICNEFEELPIKIDIVNGSVFIDNALEKKEGTFKSLKNFPDKVYGKLEISMNPNITSLEGCPSYISGSFWCNGCGLRDLKHMPAYIGGSFLAFNNMLENVDELQSCKIADEIVLDNNPIEEHFIRYTK